MEFQHSATCEWYINKYPRSTKICRNKHEYLWKYCANGDTWIEWYKDNLSFSRTEEPLSLKASERQQETQYNKLSET